MHNILSLLANRGRPITFSIALQDEKFGPCVTLAFVYCHDKQGSNWKLSPFPLYGESIRFVWSKGYERYEIHIFTPITSCYLTFKNLTMFRFYDEPGSTAEPYFGVDVTDQHYWSTKFHHQSMWMYSIDI